MGKLVQLQGEYQFHFISFRIIPMDPVSVHYVVLTIVANIGERELQARES